jgi:hypothetical protein
MTCPEDCTAIGKVRRIYAHRTGTNIWLADLPPEDTPGGEHYFELHLDHANYNALYSLLLVAATNRYNLRIRTTEDINPNSNAVVSYFVVDWP